MANCLENFTLMDVLEIKERVLNEQASKQGVEIIEGIKKAFLKDPGAKYAVLSDDYTNPKLIHAKNIEHLCENGFNVWRVSGAIQNNCYYKYFICWGVNNFQEEVFKNYMTDKIYSNYDCVELVPKHT